MKKKLLFLLCTTLIGLTACTPDKPHKNDYTHDNNNEHQNNSDNAIPDEYNGPSTTCANITMGGGQFAYHNDFIYFPWGNGICEYDLQSKDTVIIPTKENVSSWPYLSVDDDYIYFIPYEGIKLSGVTKDGKQTKTIYEDTAGNLQVYLTETHAYFMDFKGEHGSLYCRDLKTGIEEKLLSEVHAYHIDNDMIYAISLQNDTLCLFQSNLDNISFEQINLSFQPIAVIAANDTLYLSKRGEFKIIMYKDGTETILPMCSLDYQVLNKNVFYIDCFSHVLKSYNLETGEEQIIFENASAFCILRERYVAINEYVSSNTHLYDLKTKTLELMYPQEEE